MKRVILILLLGAFSNLTFGQLPANIPTDSLKAWCPFTGNAIDSSGNGNNGIVNSATLTYDRFWNYQSAYYFDGINDYIKLLHSSSLHFKTEPFTISAWVQPAAYAGVGQFIFSKERRFAPDGYQFKLALEGSSNPTDKKLFFAMGAYTNGTHWTSTAGHTLVSDSIVGLGRWYNMTVTRDGKYFKFFINGVLHSIDSSILGTVVDHTGNLNEITIGAVRDSTSSGGYFAFFKGKIDDIGVWKRLLTDWEIWNIYCPASKVNLTYSVCDSFVSPNGKVWKLSGHYSDTLINASGCDSILYYTLMFNDSVASSLSVDVCDSFVSPSGKYTWYTTGNYTDTLHNRFGCDSVIHINLNNIRSGIPIDTTVTTLPGKIVSNERHATLYEWYTQHGVMGVGDTLFAPIKGICYELHMKKSGCIFRTNCIYYKPWIGLEETDSRAFIVFPNPSTGKVFVDLRSLKKEVFIEVYDIAGQFIKEEKHKNTSQFTLQIENAGSFFVKINADGNIWQETVMVRP